MGWGVGTWPSSGGLGAFFLRKGLALPMLHEEFGGHEATGGGGQI